MKQGKKLQTKGTLKKKVDELRKKVKSLAQEAANCDSEINKLQVYIPSTTYSTDHTTPMIQNILYFE